jgi:hypothetical protein
MAGSTPRARSRGVVAHRSIVPSRRHTDCDHNDNVNCVTVEVVQVVNVVDQAPLLRLETFEHDFGVFCNIYNAE